MSTSLFVQNIIAVIWDFDKTLIPGYMQTPLFNHYDVDEGAFWKEVNGLEKEYRARGAEFVSADNLYLNHILTYVKQGIFKDLNNALLRKLGSKIQFCEGLPDCFDELKKGVAGETRYAKHEIQVEHYIVSTGLRQIILGSSVAPLVEGVWGCEFVEGSPGPGYLEAGQHNIRGLEGPESISDIAYSIDNTTKTRAIFEINKGTNKIKEIEVNASIPHEDRRIPFQNMVYIADGPSDIPVFSIINQYGGKTFAVYRPGSESEFKQTYNLVQQGRVQASGPADYSPETHTAMLIRTAVEEIADRIVADRESALSARIGLPPVHIITDVESVKKGPSKVEVKSSSPGTIGSEGADSMESLPSAEKDVG